MNEKFAHDGHVVTALPSALLRGDMDAARRDAIWAALLKSAPDAIINTAALSDTGYCAAHPDESYLSHVALPEALAGMAAKIGCKFVNCSSDQVYSGCREICAHREDEVIAPANVYGRHKLEGEQRVLQADATAVALRLTWMYDMPAYGLRTHRNRLLMLLRASMYGDKLSCSESVWRGLTYVREVAENMDGALKLAGGVYNFGSECQLCDYSNMVIWCEKLGIGERASEILEKVQGDGHSIGMDCGKIREAGIEFLDTSEGVGGVHMDYMEMFGD